MVVDLQKYQDLYFQEADRFLTQMHEELDKKDISTLHRLSHSMKSRSLVMGYPQLGTIGKALEFYFRDINEGTRTAPRDLARVIKPMLDTIKSSLEDIKAGNPEHDMAALITQLD